MTLHSDLLIVDAGRQGDLSPRLKGRYSRYQSGADQIAINVGNRRVAKPGHRPLNGAGPTRFTRK